MVPTQNTSNMMNATLPISQGGRLNIDRQQARIELDRLTEDRYNISRKLTQQVLSVFERASLSYPKIALSDQAAESALKSYDIVQDSYSHGLVSIVQLLDAQQAAVQASLYASVSVYEYLIDVITLQRSIGQFVMLQPYEEQAAYFNRLDKAKIKSPGQPIGTGNTGNGQAELACLPGDLSCFFNFMLLGRALAGIDCDMGNKRNRRKPARQGVDFGGQPGSFRVFRN